MLAGILQKPSRTENHFCRGLEEMNNKEVGEEVPLSWYQGNANSSTGNV